MSWEDSDPHIMRKTEGGPTKGSESNTFFFLRSQEEHDAIWTQAYFPRTEHKIPPVGPQGPQPPEKGLNYEIPQHYVRHHNSQNTSNQAFVLS